MSKTLTTRRHNAINALRWTACLALLAGASTGCSLLKKEEASKEAAPAATETAAPAPTDPTAGAMDPTRYADEIAESGTTTTKRQSVVRKSADQTSEILVRLNAGTAINRKARRGAYHLIEFPSGNPVTMKPGWVVQDDLSTVVQAAATTTTTASATVTASASAAPTASGAATATATTTATAAPTTETPAATATTTATAAPTATTTATAAPTATTTTTAPAGGRPPRLILKKPLRRPGVDPLLPWHFSAFCLVPMGAASPLPSLMQAKVFEAGDKFSWRGRKSVGRDPPSLVKLAWRHEPI